MSRRDCTDGSCLNWLVEKTSDGSEKWRVAGLRTPQGTKLLG